MTVKNPNDRSTTGLILKEKTLFERSRANRKGFSLPALRIPRVKPSRYGRLKLAELPEVSELQVVRHFTRLSSYNYAIDLGTLPLGSCTMKYNPRINEEIAAIDGFTDIHPDSPLSLCQGALTVISELEKMLMAISGLDSVSLQPAAGAHGEFTGLSIIRAFHRKHGSHRSIVLIPDTAHGTNPASCTLAGYETVTLKSSNEGVMSVESVETAIEKYGREIAALMVTNPNTLGTFEKNILDISERLHSIGAQMYMDGANMNAIMGFAQPKMMGVDVMQFNLHKTFSTPHGGGGPGAGPVAVRSHLAPFLPNPRIRLENGHYTLENLPESIGKVKGCFGNFGVLLRALTYILHLGRKGLIATSKTAVINANYVKAGLDGDYEVHSLPSLHECLVTDSKQVEMGGVKTLQIAKALIDEGFHPPTVYFPLVVSGAMLIEPTETETLEDLDELIDAYKQIGAQIKTGESFETAPTKTVTRKVDEVLAARTPILTLDDRI